MGNCCIKSKSSTNSQLSESLVTKNPPERTLLNPKGTIPFRKHGVKVSYLNKFIETYSSREEIKGWTTADVYEKIVKPISVASQSSFCDFLKTTDQSSSVDTAVVFISHGNIMYVFVFHPDYKSILFSP